MLPFLLFTSALWGLLRACRPTPHEDAWGNR